MKLDEEFQSNVLVIKAACYVLPSKLNDIKPTATDNESLHAFTILDSTPVFDDQLFMYLDAAEDVSGLVDTVEW